MSALKYFMKIDIVKQPVEGYCQSALLGPRAKTEVEAFVALVCTSTNDSRPLTGGTNLIWTVVDCSGSLQVPDHA